MVQRSLFRAVLSLLVITIAIPMFAQQTGALHGTVTASDGSALPGVTVEARADVLPQPRVTTTEANGGYRMPALQPGTYTVTFTLGGMQTVTRKAEVLLQHDTEVNAKLGVAAMSENITVTAEATLVDKTSTEIKSGLDSEQIQSLPIGTEYQDLVKLTPGVMFTQDTVRGPSAGGSGQDNVYQFDGVNVNLPLFGTLSAEPAAYDIAQISTVKGGAKATDFNRSAGFTIDSVSKSGTNEFKGQASFRVQNSGMTSDVKRGTNSKYEQDKTWTTINLGGPILRDRLLFYGSYYRPSIKRDNRANLYGELPDFSSRRNEAFGKLTFTPMNTLLLNGSYRKSKHVNKSDLFGSAAAPTTGTGDEATLKIGILEGSWIVNSRSYATIKYTDFANETLGRPDILSPVQISTAPGTRLDINALDQAGALAVPVPIAGNTAFNSFIAPIIAKYGYDQNGTKVGGGLVGVGSLFNDQDFFRKQGQIGYNLSLGTEVTHALHFGYQRFKDSEDLARTSNGWGDLTVPGGRTTCSASICGTAKPIYYQATFLQQSLGSSTVAVIHSEYQSQNFEVNDEIKMNNWTFNVGVVASNDTLYGQGLKEDSSTLSGYVAAPGHKYKMYDIPYRKMIQPRLGATWAYNGTDTLYASYATYNPSTSSLPRAASWDRNFQARTLRAYFDETGALMGIDPVRSSSGKLFVKDMTPRTTQEYMVGTAQQLTSRLSGRLYGRYKYSNHFWEDTENDSRLKYDPPPGVPRELYIPDLSARVAQIGSGSSYVIAELDGAFTKYYDATVEADWHAGKTFVHGSYTWSHYYGNFDQDNTTFSGSGGENFNTFIGSSNFADGPGRQVWDFKYGDLRGDRRHIWKVYGSHLLPWRASFGAYALYQSGQPWEIWDYTKYTGKPGLDTSDTNRYAETAGSRRSSPHYQLDVNYTQNIPVSRYNVQLRADLFNVFDKQTGYSIEQRIHSAAFGQPRLFYAPRLLQLTAAFQF